MKPCAPLRSFSLINKNKNNKDEENIYMIWIERWGERAKDKEGDKVIMGIGLGNKEDEGDEGDRDKRWWQEMMTRDDDKRWWQ